MKTNIKKAVGLIVAVMLIFSAAPATMAATSPESADAEYTAYYNAWVAARNAFETLLNTYNNDTAFKPALAAYELDRANFDAAVAIYEQDYQDYLDAIDLYEANPANDAYYNDVLKRQQEIEDAHADLVAWKARLETTHSGLKTKIDLYATLPSLEAAKEARFAEFNTWYTNSTNYHWLEVYDLEYNKGWANWWSSLAKFGVSPPAVDSPDRYDSINYAWVIWFEKSATYHDDPSFPGPPNTEQPYLEPLKDTNKSGVTPPSPGSLLAPTTGFSLPGGQVPTPPVKPPPTPPGSTTSTSNTTTPPAPPPPAPAPVPTPDILAELPAATAAAGEPTAEQEGAASEAVAEAAKSYAENNIDVKQAGDPVTVSGGDTPTLTTISGADIGNATVMAMVNPDGSLMPVPTKINDDGTVTVLITGDVVLVPLAVEADLGDMPGDYWAKDEIERAASLMILQSIGGDFDPTAPATGQQAMAMLLSAIGVPADYDTVLETGGSFGLTDIAEPDAPMTRIQAAKLIISVLDALGMKPSMDVEKAKEVLAGYTDVGKLNDDELVFMGILVELGIFKGNPDGTMDPGGELQCDHLVSLAVRVQDVLFGNH